MTFKTVIRLPCYTANEFTKPPFISFGFALLEQQPNGFQEKFHKYDSSNNNSPQLEQNLATKATAIQPKFLQPKSVQPKLTLIG